MDDIQELKRNLQVAIRDAVEQFVLKAEGVAQQTSEAELRRDQANADADAAAATTKSLESQIATLVPARDKLLADVAILKQAIASVTSVKL